MNALDQIDQRRKMRKMMYSKLSIFFLIMICVLLVRGLVNIYGNARESMDRKNLSAGRLVQLSERERELQKEIERLDSRVGLEEELRTRYSLSKEGEKMIVIVDNNESEAEEADLVEKKFSQKIGAWFKRAILLE